MAKHITSVNFQTYRGICNLELDALGDVNILLGDNNCGKTSFLEAIQILSRPVDFNSIVMVARQRDRFRVMAPSMFMQSPYNSFFNIFSRTQSELTMKLSCVFQQEQITTELTGEVEKTLLSSEELEGIQHARGVTVDGETETFRGILKGHRPSLFGKESANEVTLNRFSRVARQGNYPEVYPVKFLSTVDHIILDNFRVIIRNKELTRRVVHLLQQSFDSGIVDLRLIEEDDGRTSQVIEHKALGYMPLSTYGDGIKKIIAMAGAAAGIKDGVLLIDEFETAIHPKAMTQAFGFLREVCREKNLQLFVTTHSVEAVEKMLACGSKQQETRIITLYKNEDKTVARNLDAKKALEIKNELGLELR